MKVVKTNRFLLIVIITAVVMVLVGIFLWTNKNDTSNKPQVIIGEVTAISNQCNVDGICSVTLDNTRTVITGCGLRSDGKACKTYDQSRLHNGQRVEVIVMRSDATTYNLECDSCTIRALD